jgi:hypothetical protein
VGRHYCGKYVSTRSGDPALKTAIDANCDDLRSRSIRCMSLTHVLFFSISTADFPSRLQHGGTNGMVLHTRFTKTSCLLIWMSDHYGDGWDTALLTVRAPDTSNDTFYPNCNQVRNSE